MRCTKPAESAVLVGFPTSWRLPQGSKAAQRAAGNAISPQIAKAIASILMEEITPPPPPVGGLRAEIDEHRAEIDELWREIRCLKRKLSEK